MFSVDKQHRSEAVGGSLSSLLYLKGPDRFFFIHEVNYGSLMADLLI